MRKPAVYILLSLGLLLMLLLSDYYYRGWPGEKGAWITTLSFPVFLVCIFIGRALCQKWFTQSKPVWYLFYFLPLLAAVLALWYAIVRITLNLPDVGFTELAVGYAPFFILGLVTGFVVKFVRAYSQKRLDEARAIAVQKENELHQLQSQLSPHFLFNTLNNMYGISITDHKRIPKLLLKLSDLLRYSLYETSNTFVALKDELAYIRNYIEFEKMRMSDRLVLNEDIENPDGLSVRIAPMILIVFIENAFKHSKNTLTEKALVDITLNVRDGKILFRINNSYSSEHNGSELINSHSGLGLANVTKRLELLYENNYRLNISARDEKYTVELELKSM